MECRIPNQLILKEINPKYSLEGLMLRLKLQYFGHLMWRADVWRPWCWTRLRAGGEGATEDEMLGWWHHWLSGHEFEQTLGDGEGRGSLACCSPWGHKKPDTTERLNNYNNHKGVLCKREAERSESMRDIWSHDTTGFEEAGWDPCWGMQAASRS